MEFTPITTQEEFESRLKDRLEQQKRAVEAKYADYEEPRKQVKSLTEEKTALEKSAGESGKKHDDLQKQLDEANRKIKGFELDNLKAKIASETGLPLELRNRLTGEKEEDIRTDAKALAQIFKSQNDRDLPAYNNQNEGGTGKSDAAFKQMLKELKED